MFDIRQWLEKLDLGQYADAFEENDIEPDLLPHLTEETLEKVGVESAGHRLRILKAIAENAPREQATELNQEVAAPSELVAPVAERRQLTVMFCDMVGSTALSEQLDPEDLREVMAAYQKAAGAVIERYEGHVAQYLGDGLMTYFGWPKAHEDDAQRAVRAGLEIVTAVQDIEAPVALSVRVGISTGPVVVGETGAGDASVPKAAVGETPNVAARVQGLAEPNAVNISESTRRLIGNAFDLDDLGAPKLKGVSAPPPVYRVTGESEIGSRFEATHTAGLTPLVGREEEIGLLLERWQQAKDGEGQVMLLSGEPGIGKSRIIEVLRERLASQPHILMTYQCSPYHSNSALFPIIDHLQRVSGFAREDSPATRLDKLEALLGEAVDDVASVAPLIAALLSLPTDRYPASNLTPQRRKERTIEALTEQVVGLSKRNPVLTIFEDAHWADPSTIEAVTVAIDRLQVAPVLLVITHRPEFSPPWTGYGHVTALQLNRLGRRLSAELVAKVSGGKTLPDGVVDQILANTDGVPLFVEELTKTILETGDFEDTGDRYLLNAPLPLLAIPPTLRDSLVARLDRLRSAKEIAQVGAVIGRTFGFDLIAAVTGWEKAALDGALSRLIEAGLVSRRGDRETTRFTFKHALVRDAAHDTLLVRRRRDIHRRIAHVLEKRFAGGEDTDPELLAYHFTEGGLVDESVPLWLTAGRLALHRSAYREATAHIRKALGLLDAISDAANRDRLELELQATLGRILIASESWASPRVHAAFARAYDLSRGGGDSPRTFSILWALATYHLVKGDIDESVEGMEELVTLAGKLQDRDSLSVAHSAAALAKHFQGAFQESIAHKETALVHYDESVSAKLMDVYGSDRKCQAMRGGLMSLWCLGYPDRARRWDEEQRTLSKRLGNPFNLANALIISCALESDCHDVARTIARAEQALALSEEHGFKYILTAASFYREFAVAWNDPTEANFEACENILADHTVTGTQMGKSRWNSRLADLCVRLGRPRDGLSRADGVLDYIATSGERFFHAEALRVKGNALQSLNRIDEAENCFREAIELAQRQEAKSWEIRAATCLARSLADRDQRAAALNLLQPVYAWFTEGWDTDDLKQARQLIDEMS